jgi:hypothetical protein
MTRFSALTESDRFRLAGWIILALGVASALVVYGLKVRSDVPAIDDTTALGYTRSLNHGIGVMMGGFGLMLTQWQSAWTSPLGIALTIVVCAALLAAYFFRVAWVLDHDE